MASGGEGLRHDLNNDAGRRLIQLNSELARLVTTQAVADFSTYSQFMTKETLPVQEQSVDLDSGSLPRHASLLKLAVRVLVHMLLHLSGM